MVSCKQNKKNIVPWRNLTKDLNKNYVHSNSKTLWKIFFKIEKSFEEKRYKIIYGMEKYDFFLNIWLNKRFFSLKRCFPCSYLSKNIVKEN